MSKSKKLRKEITAFVNKLSPDEVREQLVLSYLQMERCKQVLRGHDVEPVTMKDNGKSSDLELFYMCKKVVEEKVYLNNVACEFLARMAEQEVNNILRENEKRISRLIVTCKARPVRYLVTEG